MSFCNKMVYRQQTLKRKEKEKNIDLNKGIDETKIKYTNIDGIIPRKFELTDYKKRKNRNCMPSKN